MMIWIYRLLFLPALLLALPYYLYRMRKRGGYGKDFLHRFGRFQQLPAPAGGKKRVWLQAVSVGEVLAIGPLIDELQKNGEIEIVLTTTTSTGYAEARKRYAENVFRVGIFPLDFWPCSRAAWRRIRPHAVILTESELWPEHLHQARRRGASTFLVNARMSDTSFNRYQSLGGLASWLFSQVDHIYASSELDLKRLLSLGGDDVHMTCTGSIKCDVPVPTDLSPGERGELRASLGFPTESGNEPFVLLGSSTWPGEEAVLLKIQRTLIEAGHDCRLLLVPRHAERRAEILRLLEDQELSWHQRSISPRPKEPVRIHLADTTGELARLTQSADLTFIGKSLPPNDGGQTPIEAAGLGIPLLMGPNMTNFKAIAEALVRNGAGKQVPDAETLEATVRQLADDPHTRANMSEAGRAWHRKNRGSSRRIAEGILADLRGSDDS